MLFDWGAEIPALLSRQVDFVSPGMGYTEDHCKEVIYSAPILVDPSGVYVARGNPKHIKSVADIAPNPDLKVALILGAITRDLR